MLNHGPGVEAEHRCAGARRTGTGHRSPGGGARHPLLEFRSMADTKLSPGATLGSYEVLEQLGRGALGVVYKCRHVHLGRMVAVKVMHPHWTESKEFVERFREEGRVLA